MSSWNERAVAALLVLCAACATNASSGSSPSPALPPAPWSAEKLEATDVSSIYLQQWARSENKSTCAPLAFARAGSGVGNSTPRAATFSGGWAVAFDQPNLRSAFGVAGTGSKATDDTYQGWPNHLEWSDGSRADYGPEGGSGPNELAYLRVAGQGCLYNVWSRLGRAHLVELLNALRFIDQ
jgi:hypothetical protein